MVSINEHYCKAPENFPFSEVLDCPSDSSNSYTRIEREVRIGPIVVGVKEPSTDGDNELWKITHVTACTLRYVLLRWKQ